MKNNLDLNDIAQKVSNVAHDTKSSIDLQIKKSGLDKVLKQANEVLGETMKNITKEFKIVNSKEGESSSGNMNTKQEHDLYVKPKNKTKAEITGKKIPAASVGGVLCTVFGALGTGASGILCIIFFALSSIGGAFFLGVKISGGILILSLLILIAGIQNIKKYARFKRYYQRLKDSLFCELKLLMGDVGKPKRLVISDLNQMRRDGHLHDVYFDKEKQNVMLDHKTYLHYEETLKNQLLKEEQLKDEVLQEAKENTNKKQSEDEKKLKEIIKKGQQQLLEIKSFNDLIKGSVIYEKVEQFYKITNVIFGAIQKMPNNINDISKVHEYYLPSVIKMLDIYVKLNVQVEETQNIKESKAHIEGAIDTLNKAFEELLNTLFEDEALDVYSDISVLHMILAQEGLIGNDDFKTTK